MAEMILLIDDDRMTIASLQPVLAREGYRVQCSAPGPGALRLVGELRPDVAVLGVSGEQDWEFCRQVLGHYERPVLLLLASGSELDRVQGLEIGADDCLLKPFLIVELIARVRALLRRDGLRASRMRQGFFVDGDLAVDLARGEVRLSGAPVPLSATEFRMLACFVEHAGEVLPAERLLALVWGSRRRGSPAYVKLYVYHLRRKLEHDPTHPTRIVTRRGMGYVFNRLGQVNIRQQAAIGG